MELGGSRLSHGQFQIGAARFEVERCALVAGRSCRLAEELAHYEADAFEVVSMGGRFEEGSCEIRLVLVAGHRPTTRSMARSLQDIHSDHEKISVIA